MFKLIGATYRDQLASLARSYEIPQNERDLHVKKRTVEGEVTKTLIFTIENAYIDFVDIDKSSSTEYSDFELRFDDYSVKGISTLLYNVEEILSSGSTFFVGGYIQGNNIIDGVECQLLHFKQNTLSLDLILRKKQDNRSPIYSPSYY